MFVFQFPIIMLKNAEQHNIKGLMNLEKIFAVLKKSKTVFFLFIWMFVVKQKIF